MVFFPSSRLLDSGTSLQLGSKTKSAVSRNKGAMLPNTSRVQSNLFLNFTSARRKYLESPIHQLYDIWTTDPEKQIGSAQ